MTRIQLRRTKGWKLPKGAKSVARPHRWGNEQAKLRKGASYEERQAAVAAYRTWLLDPNRTNGPSLAEPRGELRGRDLACFCKLDQPCHADVLLEIANSEA